MQPHSSTSTLHRPLPPPRPFPIPPRNSITTHQFSLNSANYIASRPSAPVRSSGGHARGNQAKARSIERRTGEANSGVRVGGEWKGKGRAMEGVRELQMGVRSVPSSPNAGRRPITEGKDRTRSDDPRLNLKSTSAASTSQLETPEWRFAQLKFLPPPPRLAFPRPGNTTYPSVAYYKSPLVPAASTPSQSIAGQRNEKAVGRSRSFSLLHSPVRTTNHSPTPSVPPLPSIPRPLFVYPTTTTTKSNGMAEQQWELDENFLESTDEEEDSQEVARRLGRQISGGSISFSSRRNSAGRFSVASLSTPPSPTMNTKTKKKKKMEKMGGNERTVEKKKRKRNSADYTIPLALKKLMFVDPGKANLPPSSTPLMIIDGSGVGIAAEGKEKSIVRNEFDGVIGAIEEVMGERISGEGTGMGRKEGELKKRTSSRQTRFPTTNYYAIKPSHPSTIPHFPPPLPSIRPLPFSNPPPSTTTSARPPPPKKPKLLPKKSEEELERETMDSHWAFLKVERGPRLELEWEKGWKDGGAENFLCGDIERGPVLGTVIEISLVADDILPPSYPSSSTNPTKITRTNSAAQILTLLSLSISKNSSTHGEAPDGFFWVTREEAIAHGKRGKVFGFVERELEEGGYGRMWEREEFVRSERWVERVDGKGKAKAGEN